MPDYSDPPSAHDIVEPDQRASTWIPPATGACRSEDLWLFLGRPEEPAVVRMAREEDAKRICARCAVLLECRDAALADATAAPEITGVRGGLTPEERRAIARRRRRRVSRRVAGR
ncbi:WhiB family transcriptional regulator [Yinghuangia sp. ASG 101]|uniref:WhiB family transcriptional regulator n=1 Tax=Yinghuangia sp. ASG 101 TaxID=2896848 RepID=UPI001E482E9C|nr:WhiB family transcriptional regulator [Yinghuangia sp. ASG 101]UGQ09404.1 WhiB family transcriptional regulator [Yinghuangia sp. ASG 101]